MNLKDIVKKLIVFIVLTILYQNIFYIFLLPEIYSIPIYVIYLLISYIIALTDMFIRSLPEEKSASKIYDFFILLQILLAPFFLIGAYLENKLIITPLVPLWNTVFITYIGFCFYFSGGLLVIVARTQLGRFGTAELSTAEDHQLFTQGVYQYIRNPMYSGGLIATLGFSLIFRCIIILCILFVFNFLIYRMRIFEEERVLFKKFGQEFEDYKKRTKRLFPFLY